MGSLLTPCLRMGWRREHQECRQNCESPLSGNSFLTSPSGKAEGFRAGGRRQEAGGRREKLSVYSLRRLCLHSKTMLLCNFMFFNHKRLPLILCFTRHKSFLGLHRWLDQLCFSISPSTRHDTSARYCN